VLGATLVQPLVAGIQNHVMAITKHYMLNNQETDRSGVNEIVDEKTIMELYSPAFGAAAASSAGYMCAVSRQSSTTQYRNICVPSSLLCASASRRRIRILAHPTAWNPLYANVQYNRINGIWACENPLTVKTILKG
jgi:beta-glucosidase-like glycosyl hydrolase